MTYMKPDVVYKVTKGNTEGSIKADDIVYIYRQGGRFYCSTKMG